MKPEDFADAANNCELHEHKEDDQIKAFLRNASARDIQTFIHGLNTGAQPQFFGLARVALDIRLAEDAEKTARNVVALTWGLIALTLALLVFAAHTDKNSCKTTQGYNTKANADA
jgi:hypothetical protein